MSLFKLKDKMKKIILSFLLLLMITSVFSQRSQSVKSDWITAVENDNVLISKRTVQIDDVANGMHSEYVQFKCQNKTSSQLFLSWYFDAKYQANVTTDLSDENYRAFLLDPNQEFIPDFSNQNDFKYFVFKKLMDLDNKLELLSVQLAKLTTKKIK